MNIKTWQEVSNQFTLDRRAMATNQMIWMQQEIDELRAAYEAQAHRANALALVVNDLTKIVTHSAETKEQFIERVKAILSVDPDLRVSEIQKAYEALQERLDRLNGLYHSEVSNHQLDYNALKAENAAQAKRIAELEAAVKANHEWHQEHDDYDGYRESELCTTNTAALAASKNGE